MLPWHLQRSHSRCASGLEPQKTLYDHYVIRDPFRAIVASNY